MSLLLLLRPTTSEDSGSGAVFGTTLGDGAPSDEGLPALYSSNRVVGDVYPQGTDDPFLRLVETLTGGGLFTTNSDPNVVGVDPLTGEDAPAGTDVGFGAALRRFIHGGVLNGDFSIPPPDTADYIGDSNPLPYWTWSPDGTSSDPLPTWTTGASASGGMLHISAPVSHNAGTLSQLVPIPRSQGQQYRVVLSSYAAITGTLLSFSLAWQYAEADGTLIGSETSTLFLAAAEVRMDAGLVPPTASYIKVSLVVSATTNAFEADIYEIRAAFLPAEATIGLASRVTDSATITTSQTQIMGVTIPANTFVVGSVYEFDVWGNVTSSAANTVTFRIRCGASSLTGTIVHSFAPTATTSASDNSFHLTGMVTIRSVGASGSIIGGLQFVGQDAQPFTVQQRADQATATVTVDTTAARILEMTAVTAAGTTSVTIQQATIRCVMAS